MQINPVYDISFGVHTNSKVAKCTVHLTFFSSYLSSKIQEMYFNVKPQLTTHTYTHTHTHIYIYIYIYISKQQNAV